MIYSIYYWIVSLVQQGGVLVPIIAGVSILGVTLIIKKHFELQREEVLPEEDRKDLLRSMFNGNDGKWPEKVNDPMTPMHDILRGIILTMNMDEKKRENFLLTRSNSWMREVSKGISSLGILATISPLLGILGTVIGMIYTMNEVGNVSGADPAAVGRGIGQALITTAMGLIVGIPLMIFHRRFKSQVNELSADLHASVYETIDRIDRIEAHRNDQDLPSLTQLVDRPEDFELGEEKSHNNEHA